MIINFHAVDSAQDFVNFASNGFQLPNNPTPEQFKKAEPILIQQIIEQNYDTGAFESRENGEYEGDIIDPIDMSKVRMVSPGRYVGEFSDEGNRYRFEIGDNDVIFSPIDSTAQ